MQVADERIETSRGQRRNAVVAQQRVQKRQQAVHRIKRRPSAAARKREIQPLLAQMKSEHFEIEISALPLEATNAIREI